MTFLKKLGQIINTVSEIFLGFAPFITKTIPQTGQTVQIISNDLSAIADEVANIEAIGQTSGMTGPDRAKYLAPIVAKIILGSATFTKLKIKDQAKFMEGCGEIGGGVADILNSFHEDSTAIVVSQVSK